jgi:hypothetical protein
MITFHGTSSIDSANSIVKYGHVLPNEVNIETGTPNVMKTGDLYGYGVYSSTDI